MFFSPWRSSSAKHASIGQLLSDKITSINLRYSYQLLKPSYMSFTFKSCTGSYVSTTVGSGT